MTGPGPARGADGRFIGRGYVEVNLKDSIDDDLAKLQAKLGRVKPVTIPVDVDGRQVRSEVEKAVGTARAGAKPVTIPVGVKVDGQREVEQLRRQLDAVKASGTGLAAAQTKQAAAAAQVARAFEDEASAAGRLEDARAELELGFERGSIGGAREAVLRERITRGMAEQEAASERLAQAMAAEGAAARELAAAQAVTAKATEQASTAAADGARAARVAGTESTRVAAARDREATAAGRVRVAELQLEEVRARDKATASQVAAAEEQLAAAKRQHEAASRGVAAQVAREAAELAKLAAQQDRLRRGGVIPVGVKVSPTAGPELTRLRDQLREVKASASVKPTWEAREFTNAYGETYTRYVKVSKTTGTLAGEGLGASMYKGVAAMMRMPGLFGPVLTAAGALMTARAILAIPAGFARIGAEIQASNAEVSRSFFTLQRDVESALRVDTAPLSTSLISANQRIGASFQTLRPQIRDVFTELPPQIDTLTVGVTRFATNAMPGLVRAVDQADPVVAGLADGMASAGEGVTRFYTATITGAPEAGQALRSVGVIASDAAELAGRVAAAVTEVFGGQVWNEAEATFDRLFRIVGNFATNALPPLGTGLEIATGAANVALAVLEPFSRLIGTITGTVLGATVVVRGFSAALGLIASAKVLTTLAPLKSAFTTLTTQVATSGVGFSAWATKATGSAAAGEKVAAASNKVVGGLRAVGNNLPVIGAGLTALAITYETLGSKASEVASQVVAGSKTLQQAINDERNVIELDNIQWLGGLSAKEEDALARRNVVEAVKAQEASMGALERAQSRVARSQVEYDAALAEHGAGSQEATKWAAELGAAQEDLARQQHAAEQATKSHTQALVEQTDIMRGSVDAEFAYRDAVAETAEAQAAAAAAVKEHGVGSKEAQAATTDLAKAMHSQAEAASKAADAAYAGLDPQTRAVKAAEAYRTELLRTADVSTGPGRAAFAQIAGSMNNVELAALSATAKASGLKTEIVTLPDGRTVTIVTNTDRAKLDQLNDDFRGLDGKVATVTVAGQTAPFNNALAGALAAVSAAQPTMTINGNPVPVRDVLGAVLAQTNSAKGTMSIDGNPTLVNGKVTTAVKFADGSKGTITIDGKPDPATGKVTATVKYADGSTGTIKLDANPAQANSKVDGVVRTAAGRVAWIPADANTSRATSALNNLVTTWQGRTIYVNIGGNRVTAGGGVFGYAGGGIHGATRGGDGASLPGFAGGGWKRASQRSGMVIPGYSPGVDTEPTLMSKGEAVLVPELTRLLGARRILAANAEASGGRPATVVGQVASIMDGLVGATRAVKPAAQAAPTVVAVTAPAATSSGASGTASPTIINHNTYNLTVQVDGRLDLNNPLDTRRLGAKLTEILRDHDRSTR